MANENMPRCKTCQHWCFIPGRPERKHWGLEAVREMGWCALMIRFPVHGESLSGVRIFIDSEDCRWAALVGPDFGCVHHEPKERRVFRPAHCVNLEAENLPPEG